MINWKETKKQLNRSDTSGYRPKVVMQCDECGHQQIVTLRKKCDIKDNQKPWICGACANKKPERLEKLRVASKALWQDPTYVANNLKAVRSDENRQRLSKIQKDPTVQAKIHTKINRAKASKRAKEQWKNPEFRKLIVESSTKMWDDPALAEQMLKSRRTQEYRKNQSQNALKRWGDPEYIANQQSVAAKATRDAGHLAALRANQPKVSSIQEILYSILDDLGVKYYREWNDKVDDPECTIGPYSLDCVIPREGKTSLLIECQGEYWHNVDENVARDRAKATYIANNFADKYDLKCIWEHEFENRDKIVELVKYWLGLTELELIDFDFSDIVIKECPINECKLLLSKYHYLANVARGGSSYGAYLGTELVAVCIFSPLVRQNITVEGYNSKNTCELSRLCIHPRYQKYNFASWFISKCIKLLDTKYKCIISYCDTTHNHDGTIYKASNFVQDKVVRPDYWYVNQHNGIVHKKTLYERAVKEGLKESEYAQRMGYSKVYGSEKLRFVYKRT